MSGCNPNQGQAGWPELGPEEQGWSQNHTEDAPVVVAKGEGTGLLFLHFLFPQVSLKGQATQRSGARQLGKCNAQQSGVEQGEG